MRCLVLILLMAGAARAVNPLLVEERAWRGVVEVSSVSIAPPMGAGAETQTERLEFVLLTKPPKKTMGWARLPFEMRETTGRYELAVDTREGEGADAVRSKGRGAGALHARVAGFIEPGTRRYRFQIRVEPARIVARTVLSGLWRGRVATWRTVTARAPFLAAFEAEGRASEGARVIEGERKLVNRKAKLRRDVTIKWRIERIDPVIAGRITDHHGRPVAGVTVVASNTNPGRVKNRLPPIFREATTGADGRYELPVFWAHWNVQVKGLRKDGVIYGGKRLEHGATIRFDDVPRFDVTMNAYRHRALPDANLLDRHFQGDVDRYLFYIRERASARRLRAARAD